MWAYIVIASTVLLAYGAVWTRGVAGDDLCMCELATSTGYWDAVQVWLQKWNSRLFLALTQIGTYRLPWFARPLDAPWFLLHASVVLAHLAVCCLLLSLLSRAGLGMAPSLAAVLVLAIHPITSESVLWLAGGYGYVFGSLLTILAVWSYLEYDRSGRRIWLVSASVLALLATLGIEQFLVVLAALSVIHLLRARWHGAGQPAWIPLGIVAGCTLVFVAVHFGLFPGTSNRLAWATTKLDPVTRPGILWMLAWWLSLVPDASAWGDSMRFGLGVVKQSIWLAALIVIATLVAGWRIASLNSWRGSARREMASRYMWLIAAGIAIALAALLPFVFSGAVGFPMRSAYVVLPGLLIAGAAVLDWLASPAALRPYIRYGLAPLVCLVVAASLVIGVGEQARRASSWRFHQEMIRIIEANASAIRASQGLEVTFASREPHRLAIPIHEWMLPCLVRWVVADGSVKASFSHTPAKDKHSIPPGSHRIYLQLD
jgi:hypothetical protein